MALEHDVTKIVSCQGHRTFGTIINCISTCTEDSQVHVQSPGCSSPSPSNQFVFEQTTALAASYFSTDGYVGLGVAMQTKKSGCGSLYAASENTDMKLESLPFSLQIQCFPSHRVNLQMAVMYRYLYMTADIGSVTVTTLKHGRACRVGSELEQIPRLAWALRV